jgi:TRAP-type C4-dicarboxylate transport system substrate-binding protein
MAAEARTAESTGMRLRTVEAPEVPHTSPMTTGMRSVTEDAVAATTPLPPVSTMRATDMNRLTGARDTAHLAKVMAGPIGEDLNRQLIEKRGVRILGTTYYGVRQLTTTNKAVRTVADMKEFKLRVPENEIFLAMARSWGAKPTPMTFGELYLALRQNVVDGQENPSDHDLVLRCRSTVLTAHILTPRIVAMNEKFWQGLPAADRQMISAALAEGIAWNNQETEAAERTLVEKFKKAGMEVIQPDYESFRKPVLDTVPKMFESRWGKGLFERIVDTK